MTTLLLFLSAVSSGGHAPENRIHPIFPFLDADGRKVIESGRAMSTDTTCGNCHDAPFIDSHSSHKNDTVRSSCLSCHLPSGHPPAGADVLDETGFVKRGLVTIRGPEPENCALCHGVIYNDPAPLVLPDDFERLSRSQENPNFYDLTKWTGEILSGQRLIDSYLNLAGKGERVATWDVHSARLVGCSACHHARNNPQKMRVEGEQLPFLVHDPRRLSLSQYLYRPDHRLAAEACERCHNPLAIHGGLPYPEQHFARLDCRSCHTPRLWGPAWKTVDHTVLTQRGEPRIAYRGLHEDDPDYFSAAHLTGYRPFFLWRQGENGARELAPYNIVTRFEWISGDLREPVPMDRLRAAYFEEGSYAPEVMAALDIDRDGSLSPDELRLDSTAKVSVVRDRLLADGVVDPQVQTRLIPHPVHHGVQDRSATAFDCENCHGRPSRLSEAIPLADYSIPGSVVTIADGDQILLAGVALSDRDGNLVFHRSSSSEAYVLGHDRAPWTDSLGLTILILTIVAIGVHGAWRLRVKRRRAADETPVDRVYMYTVYERIWHWAMAASILLLAFTGIEIHWITEGSLLGLANAVTLHNLLAVIMIANAFLSLFYHTVSGDIRQFIPPKASFFAGVKAQARYYLNGIFVGAPHPTAKTPQRKLNPLQQVTYMTLLNVLFPFQVMSGILIWGISRWSGLSEAIGGLTIITPLHNFGAWLVVTFILAHVYLTTTGHTAISNVRAMVTGFDQVEIIPSDGRE